MLQHINTGWTVVDFAPPNPPNPSLSPMVSQNHTPSHSPSRHSRRKPRSRAVQPRPKPQQVPASRVLCAHCGKKLSASAAYRHELIWNSRTAASLAEANPLPHNYPLASPPTSPWRAVPSSDDPVSPWHTSELSEEGLNHNDLRIGSLSSTPTRSPIHSEDDLGNLNDDLDNPNDNFNPDFADDDGAGDMDDEHMQDTNVQTADRAISREDQQEEGWRGISDLDGGDWFGFEGDEGRGDDFRCDDGTGDIQMHAADGMDQDGGAEGQVEGSGNADEGEGGGGSGASDDEADDPMYGEGTSGSHSRTSSGASTETSSEATDSDEFMVRRWSDEEDPPPQQHGFSRHLPPLLPIGANSEVLIGRSRK